MNILITGASGFIGSAVAQHLATLGHHIIPLARGARIPGRPWWNPDIGEIDLAPAGPLDAAIHLAGENIAAGRWTAARKTRILTSRATSTALLARTLAAQTPRPATLISASAIGIYGNRGDDIVDEARADGIGFLSSVCRAWESAAAPAADSGIRVVFARIGIVLHPAGGALAKMLPPFRFGLGGPIGNGRQWMSWIALDDLVAIIAHVLEQTALTGPLNVVTPNPVTNRDFTGTLGRVLHRPAALPLPACVARLLLGEMADALLLASTRITPARLQQSGFHFQHPNLEPALRHLLTRTP